jgi:hypothetical protein
MKHEIAFGYAIKASPIFPSSLPLTPRSKRRGRDEEEANIEHRTLNER